MPRRFLVTGPLAAGRHRLEGAEAHHLLHVLRIGVGQSVTLFDGSGIEATAEVIGVAPGTVDVEVCDTHVGESEAVTSLVLAAAVPKGDRFAWLIEKATELGVQRFVPLVTERSVVVPGEGKLEKMRRTIVEASKQCGRARLMELALPMHWPEFVARDLAPAGGWVAHRAGTACEWAGRPAADSVVAAVGPEGGFTDGELDLAVRSGAKLVSLGPRILRIETAALALATLATCSSSAWPARDR